MRSRGLAVVGFVLAALAAGCMGDGGASVEASALPRLVLQPQDVGDDFVQFDEGRLARGDLQPGPRSDARRFGRIDGWKARYRLAAARGGVGPIVVVSLVDLFDDEGGARSDLAAYRAEFEMLGQDEVEVPRIGEAAVAVTFIQQALEEVRFYTIAWRQANVTASVTVQGFELTLADAVALARKQETRIAAAAGG